MKRITYTWVKIIFPYKLTECIQAFFSSLKNEIQYYQLNFKIFPHNVYRDLLQFHSKSAYI